VEIAVNEEPKLTLPVQPPQVPQPKQRPAFEDVTPITPVPPGQRVMDMPGSSVAGAIRGSLAGRGAAIDGTAPVASTGADLPQLLSDPKGIDFRPYLANVLASVKRYWLSIMPNTAIRGYVSLQFAIQRDGTVRKIVTAQSTGNRIQENAAVSAVSGGGPFGPLPLQYRDNEIRVQMNFAYNVPKQ
jgi:TonB family protein